MPPQNHPQRQTALTLLQSGLLTIMTGLIIPIFILSTFTSSHPVNHTSNQSPTIPVNIQLCTFGTLLTVIGLLLFQKNLLDLGDTGLLIVKWGVLSNWSRMALEVGKGVWGAGDITSEALGTITWQGYLTTVTQVISTIGSIVAFMVLAIGVWDVNIREEEEENEKED